MGASSWVRVALVSGLVSGCYFVDDDGESDPIGDPPPAQPQPQPDPGVDPPPAAPKRIFVTRLSYPADLATAGEAPDGLSGADHICNVSASAAELGGVWLAWLSTSSVDAIDRIEDVGPWHLVNGTKVFNNKDNLRTSPIAGVTLSEWGTFVDDQFWGYGTVWTGTTVGGRADAETCNDWTSTDDAVRAPFGQTSATFGGWTHSGRTYCDDYKHLYCIEQ